MCGSVLSPYTRITLLRTLGYYIQCIGPILGLALARLSVLLAIPSFHPQEYSVSVSSKALLMIEYGTHQFLMQSLIYISLSPT